MSESDGMEETFEGQLRVGLLVAGRVAEEVARMHERAARAAEARSLQAAREQQERIVAERLMARAALAPVERDGWWQRAHAADLAAAWQTARTWEAVEPDARRAADTIRGQVRERYGIDVDDLGDRDGALAQAVAERGKAAAGRGSREEWARSDQERAVVTLLASENAEELEQAAGQVSAESSPTGTVPGDDPRAVADVVPPVYDSPQRRQEFAEHLKQTVDPQHAEAIEARVIADTTNARPVTDVATQPGVAAAARPRRRFTPGLGQQRGVER